MQSEIVKYFNKITPYTAISEQEDVLNSILAENKLLISAGRGCGKTLVVAAAATYLAEELDEPTKILVISAQDSWVLYYLRKIYQENNYLYDSLVSRSNQFVIPATGYSNTKGSDVFVRGTAERAIRGAHAPILIIDEAALVPNEAIITALGCLTGEDPKIILLSTPTEDEDALFNKWLVDPDSGYKKLTWTAENLPWNNNIILETQTEEYSPSQYATQVLGRPPTDKEIEASKKVHGIVLIYDTNNREVEQVHRSSSGHIIH